MGPRDQIQVVRTGGKLLYPQGHFYQSVTELKLFVTADAWGEKFCSAPSTDADPVTLKDNSNPSAAKGLEHTEAIL